MNVSIKHIRKYYSLYFYLEYTKPCPRWASFSFELPDDVFYEGQARPAKANKKPKKRVHAMMDATESV